MYTNRGRTRKGRWCRLTFFGKSTQGAGPLRGRACRYPGTIKLTKQEGGREPLKVIDDQPVSEATVTMLETLERHAYHRLTVCIDNGQYDEAREIVDLLKEVGIV